MENFGSVFETAGVFVRACIAISEGVDRPITLLFAVSSIPFASGWNKAPYFRVEYGTSEITTAGWCEGA